MQKEVAMSQNLISLTLTDEQIAAALAGLQQIEAALAGLISLESGERRKTGVRKTGGRVHFLSRSPSVGKKRSGSFVRFGK